MLNLNVCMQLENSQAGGETEQLYLNADTLPAASTALSIRQTRMVMIRESYLDSCSRHGACCCCNTGRFYTSLCSSCCCDHLASFALHNGV
jgi:hypothetical protein